MAAVQKDLMHLVKKDAERLANRQNNTRCGSSSQAAFRRLGKPLSDEQFRELIRQTDDGDLFK